MSQECFSRILSFISYLASKQDHQSQTSVPLPDRTRRWSARPSLGLKPLPLLPAANQKQTDTMTNRPHTPDSSANTTDTEASTETEGAVEQTEEPHHDSTREAIIKDPSPIIVNTDTAHTSFDKHSRGMKTSSTHTPAASHIRLKHQNVDFIIPPCVPVQSAPLPGANVSTPPDDADDEVPEPPVTAKGLWELRIDKIVNNLKLRHDINFDSELHYRANLDGDMGRTKIAQNNKFWGRLETDLMAFTYNPQMFQRKHGQNWTLPCVLKNIKSIVVTLVAPDVVALVEETLEIDHLMQELTKNVADLERWAGMVADFLRNCCAPMRDPLVKTMQETLVDGHRHHDIRILVQGIQNLLFLVEAMALDVANHQIRCLKHQMILETVNYERHYIEKIVQTGEFDIPYAYCWYKYYHEADIPDEFPEQGFRDVPDTGHDFTWFEYDGHARGFYGGIIHNLAYPLCSMELPRTFIADFDRIGRLRAGVLEAVNFEICIAILEHFTRNFEWSTRRRDVEVATLRRHLWYILGDHCQEVDVMIPLEEMSTPREQSLGIPRRFIQHKWQVAAPAVAVEILRASTLPHEMLPEIEAELNKSLSNDKSPRFMKCQAETIYRLGGLIENALANWNKMNSFQLYLAAAKPPADENDFWCHKINPNNGPEMIIRNLARVITHMGIHHWRIWQPLAYLPYSRYIAPYQRDRHWPVEELSHPPTQCLQPDMELEESSDDSLSDDAALPRHMNENPVGYRPAYKLGGDLTRPLTPGREHSHAMLPEGVHSDRMPKEGDQKVSCAAEIDELEKLTKIETEESATCGEKAVEDDSVDPPPAPEQEGR